MKGEVYLLLSSKDNKTYIGSTNNIKKRLAEHNSGKVNSTKHRRPLKLIYTEEYETLDKARVHERFLKTRQGRRELNKIFSKLKID
jgi:putative endonuclease